MAVEIESTQDGTDAPLDADFSSRLARALPAADSRRRRRAFRVRLASLAPALLLVGPLVAWKLTLATPGGTHIVVGALVSLTFALNVAVHVDTAVLSYLHLQVVPTVAGVLVLLLTGLHLLLPPEPPR